MLEDIEGLEVVGICRLQEVFDRDFGVLRGKGGERGTVASVGEFQVVGHDVFQADLQETVLDQDHGFYAFFAGLAVAAKLGENGLILRFDGRVRTLYKGGDLYD